MSPKNALIAGLAILSLGAGSAAQAGFVTLNTQNPGATTIDIVPSNEFKPILKDFGVKQYTLSAMLGLDEIGSVTYYYYGKEAGYQNVFLTDNLVFGTGYTPNTQNYFYNPITIGTVEAGVGALDFTFCALSWPGILQGCVNNQQNDRLGLFSNQSIAYSVAGNIAWLFWDDSGAGPDDNHDDMIIKAVFNGKAKGVPEPATLGLFGLGLLGVWIATRRRALRA